MNRAIPTRRQREAAASEAARAAAAADRRKAEDFEGIAATLEAGDQWREADRYWARAARIWDRLGEPALARRDRANMTRK